MGTDMVVTRDDPLFDTGVLLLQEAHEIGMCKLNALRFVLRPQYEETGQGACLVARIPQDAIGAVIFVPVAVICSKSLGRERWWTVEVVRSTHDNQTLHPVCQQIRLRQEQTRHDRPSSGMAVYEYRIRVRHTSEPLHDIRESLADVLVWLRVLRVWDEAVVWDDGQESSGGEEGADTGVHQIGVVGRWANAFSRCKATSVYEEKDR